MAEYRLMIGTTVSRYKILSKLGRGGMGVVYEAEDTELGRRVAVKFLPPETAQSAETLERFKREARAASALNHPHICTIHDAGVYRSQPFLVMEKLEGQTLRNRIGGHSMPIGEVVKLGEQLADALDAAHRAGIVHRDLKPGNLFITERGDAKILDFGLAKVVPQEASGPSTPEAPTVTQEHLTEAGTTLGTIAYMSPEQARGQQVDARSDLFSLGVVLYEMTTGRLPFQGDSPAELFVSILQHDPIPPSDLEPDIPPRLEDTILKALDKDPALRYQTAAELRGDLRRLQRDSSGAAGSAPPLPKRAPESSANEARAPGRSRGRWIAVAMAIVVVAAVAYLAKRVVTPGVAGSGSEEAGGVAESGRAPTSEIHKQSIAVLPFADMSEKGDQEYFADGLAEELMGMLAKIPELKVPARSSSFSFKGTQATVSEIGKTLGVAHLLEGSVRKSGDRLRVSAQLIRAEDGFQLWSETYDRRLDDVFELQDEISGAVVRALELRLLDADMPKASRTHSQEAYSLFLQARALHYRATHADLQTGIRYLERALELDPNFAPAWFGLGDTLIADYTIFGSGAYEEVRRRAGEAAEKALRLDPQLADAHLLMGRLLGELDWDWPAAEVELQRALALDPNNTLALWVASGYAMIGDRLDEALRLAERLVAVDPVSANSYWAMGDVQLRLGRSVDAEAAYRKTMELNPTAGTLHTLVGITLLRQGRPADALAVIEHETDEGWKLYGLALANDALGRRGDADRALAELEAGAAEGRAWSIGSIYACRQELDRAFDWLDRAYRQREGWLPFIQSDACVGFLEPDPRYGELRRKLNLPVST